MLLAEVRAQNLYKNVPLALNALNMPLEVKHQSGKKSVGVKESYSSKISIEVKEFYDSPHDAILWSDFIISRAETFIVDYKF